MDDDVDVRLLLVPPCSSADLVLRANVRLADRMQVGRCILAGGAHFHERSFSALLTKLQTLRIVIRRLVRRA